MLETYLKQITYYKVNINGQVLISEVMAVNFGQVTAITSGTVWQSRLSTTWFYGPVTDQQAFSETGPDLPVIDQIFFLIFFQNS